MIRERILFRLFFSLLLLLSFSPFCTYEPTSQIHPNNPTNKNEVRCRKGNEGFLQRDSVEQKGDAEAQSTDHREGKERGGASDLLEAILDRDNLNRGYKRVKRNH